MNCTTCQYSESVHNGINCTRNILDDGRIAFIPSKKISKDCPCHSEIMDVEETRANFKNTYRINSSDVCPFCNRLVRKQSDFRQYKTENDKGKIKTVNICRICFEKR